jgi:hypothetical protein
MSTQITHSRAGNLPARRSGATHISGGYRAWSASPLVTIRDDIQAPIKMRWTPAD